MSSPLMFASQVLGGSDPGAQPEIELVAGGTARSARDAIVGDSPALKKVLQQLELVARTEASVLLRGETGTGKELLARVIHEASPRRGGPFVKVNLAAIPASLLESEIFGHERGAFTGAVARRLGLFEQAHGGTLFLDEIGELVPELQPKLLRVLQEREFQRVGGVQTLRCNVRVLSATHRDLRSLVGAGSFRADLYYRLNVFPIQVPSLAERRDDIPLLASHFVRQHAHELQRAAPRLTAASLAKLSSHDWPGNIRELQNVVQRSLILCQGPALHVELEDEPVSAQPRQSHEDELSAVTRSHILRVLEDCRWVIAGPHGAAARLGMKRTTLNARLKKLGISRRLPSGIE